MFKCIDCGAETVPRTNWDKIPHRLFHEVSDYHHRCHRCYMLDRERRGYVTIKEKELKTESELPELENSKRIEAIRKRLCR